MKLCPAGLCIGCTCGALFRHHRTPAAIQSDPLCRTLFRLVDDFHRSLPDRFAGGGNHGRTSTWLDEGTGCADPASAGALAAGCRHRGHPLNAAIPRPR